MAAWAASAPRAGAAPNRIFYCDDPQTCGTGMQTMQIYNYFSGFRAGVWLREDVSLHGYGYAIQAAPGRYQNRSALALRSWLIASQQTSAETRNVS